MSLTDNYFTLFNLPETYALDAELLAEKYWLLQKQTHPDRFASASKQDQLKSAQYAAIVNDAYEVLKSPLKRAIYMLKLKGLELDDQRSSNLSPDFLMQQIELRETLEDIKANDKPQAALEALDEKLQEQLAEFERALDVYFKEATESAIKTAVETVNKMHFIIKMLKEVERLEDQLHDG